MNLRSMDFEITHVQGELKSSHLNDESNLISITKYVGPRPFHHSI